MFGFFRAKREVKRIEDEIKRSFESTKKDFSRVGEWITHLDDKSTKNNDEIIELKNQINALSEDLEDLKDSILLLGGGLSKHKQTSVVKQTGAVDVQTAVQTAVQTSILSNLTTSERLLIFALLRANGEDMKLSYKDLADILGKDKSTIRGQINAIKQKSESLIGEYQELNGEKRLFIPEEVARLITKSVKVRVNRSKKKEKRRKSEIEDEQLYS